MVFQYDKLIYSLYEVLETNGILKRLYRRLPFSDEPKMLMYSAFITTENFSDGVPWKGSAGGFSFSSRKLALLKCLVEAAERFGNSVYRENTLKYDTFENLKQQALNPNLYKGSKKDLLTGRLSWAKGFIIPGKVKCLIPAQLVYLNYKLKPDELYLEDRISTGAAGGVDYESTILRGIYEIIERDAFMGVYLAKTEIPEIIIDSSMPSKIKSILMQARRYKLEIKLFEITTDMEIPTFMSIVIDRTGIGPIVSVGLKSNISAATAALGSIEETFHPRPWLRDELNKGKSVKSSYADINTLVERGLFWLEPKMLNKLSFLFAKKPVKKAVRHSNYALKDEFNYITKLLVGKKLSLFGVDITPELLKNSGFCSYKVIIPEMQPLFLKERHRRILIDRVKTISKHFGQRVLEINEVPHPFL